jgi:hypothetical protein
MEFNKTFLANWVLSGFKFIHYKPFANYALLTPLEFNRTPNQGYVIPISDLQALEMSNEIEDFKFYINVLS